MATPRLFPLPLRGVGTTEIEALSSYLQRLAIAHGVSVWKLLERVRSWYHRDHPDFVDCLEGVFSSPDLSIFVRPNKATQQIVVILEHVTCNKELRCGTFLSLIEALDRSVGLFAHRPRWCPACMREFERAEDDGYLKLLWFLKPITHCPTHGIPLHEKCDQCGADQRTSKFDPHFTRCSACKMRFSRSLEMQRPQKTWNYQGADLIDLVETIASSKNLMFPAGGVRRMVSALFDRVWAEREELRFWKILPRDECIMIANGDEPVTLATARKLAFRIGVPIPDLLMGRVELTSGILDPEWTKDLPKDMQPKRRRKRHDREHILQKMKQATSDHAGSPLSLKRVAGRVGVSVGCLEYHFPAQSRDIVTRYHAWKTELQNRKKIEARAAAMTFFTSDRYGRHPRSRKQALRTLRRETGLPKNILREAIAAVSVLLTVKAD